MTMYYKTSAYKKRRFIYVTLVHGESGLLKFAIYKTLDKGIHLLWSLTKDEEILKYQTLELSNVSDVLQQAST